MHSNPRYRPNAKFPVDGAADARAESRDSFRCLTCATSFFARGVAFCCATLLAGCLELLSLGTSHFVDHSGKNVTYRNHKVTPIRTKRLVTIIVSLVRDQARFGFRHGILTSHFRQRPGRSCVLAATRRELEPRSAWSPQRVGVPAELHGGLVRSGRGEKEQVPAWLSSRFLRTMLAYLRAGQGQGDQANHHLNLILARTSMFCRCSRAMSWLLQNNVFSCGREDGRDWDDCYLPSQNLLKRRRGQTIESRSSPSLAGTGHRRSR
jgi:hypothetical protein